MRWISARRCRSLCAGLGLLPACTPDPTPDPPGWPRGEPMTLTLDGQPLVEGQFDGGPTLLWALDTGADGMYLDRDLAPGVLNPEGELRLGATELGELTLRALDLREAEAFLGVDLGGLAGQPFFAERVVTLDYAAARLIVGDALPEGTPAAARGTVATLPVDLDLGIPVVELDLGIGEPVAFIADTGSGVTMITESQFAALNDDSLPRLHGYVWATNRGRDDAFVTRLPTLRADGENIDGSWAIVVPDDHHLADLLRLAGLPSQFLGFPFYRRGALAVDGPAEEFTFWPYAAGADPDEWRRVGVELTWREGSAVVEMLFSPSDAEDAGVLVGDRVLEIDGVIPGSLDAARLLLRGTGERLLRLSRGEDELSLTVSAQDLLPLL